MNRIVILAAVLLTAAAVPTQLPAETRHPAEQQSAAASPSADGEWLPAEQHLDKQALRPRYRQWMQPAGGVPVTQNPPALLWPAGGDDVTGYRIELSPSPEFPAAQTLTSEQPWAVWALHRPLAPGRYWWRVTTFTRKGAPQRSAACEFVVADSVRRFATPTGDELVQRLAAQSHPRLYVTADGIGALRRRSAANPEAQEFLTRTRRRIDMEPVPVAPTRPRDTTGMSPFQKRSLINFMYHKFGEVVTQPIVDFSLAWLLTGDEAWRTAVVRHARYVASLPVDSDATSEDFNRSAIMYGLAFGYDTACERMTDDERAAVLEAIRVRGERFYRQYVRDFECHSMDNHVWQHTFRNFLFTALATLGDLPEAERWLRYCYEVWCGRFPILGGDDGGWHDGSSYMQANLVTFIYVPFVLSRLTGSDFFALPWYRNLPSFLAYSFPKDSYATGFGDDYEKMTSPTQLYMGFADALARETHSPLARWYADQLIGADPANLYRSKGFMLYRILTDKPRDCVAPEPPVRNTSRFFPDAGFSLMHTDPADAGDDLMAAFFALPFGSTGHAHAAHNGFTINYGGRPLFGGTGYYSNFNDRHTLLHYRTRGHNTLLIDSLAQVIGENGYGWLARFADTEALTYTLGDASHAYDSIRTPFWIDRMEKSGVEYTRANGLGDPGVTRFRRHFLFLRPDVIVIYDDLAARQPVTWTWLLHGNNRLTRCGAAAVETTNGRATGRMDLFTAGPLQLRITDEFFSPAINWKRRTGPDGRVLEYARQWHSEFTPEGRSRTQRFLAIFRITPEGARPLKLTQRADGTIRVGEWTVRAELDGSRQPRLEVTDRRGNGVRYNTSSSTVAGSTLILRPGAPARELVDTVPASVR